MFMTYYNNHFPSLHTNNLQTNYTNGGYFNGAKLLLLIILTFMITFSII